MKTKTNTALRAGITLSLGIFILVTIYSLGFLGTDKNKSTILFNANQQAVVLTAEDGRKIDAVLAVPSPRAETRAPTSYPAVILLSPYMESGQIYGPVPEMLCQTGMVVLTVNMRASQGPDGTVKLDPQDLANLHLDAEAAIQFAQKTDGVDPARIGIMGTGLSSRAAILATGKLKAIKALALISATLDEHAQKILAEPAFPVFSIFVSINDGPAALQAEDLVAMSKNKASRLRSFFNAGEGSQIWISPSNFELAEAVISWFNEQL